MATGNFEIKVCWMGHYTSDLQQRAEGALQQTWQAASGIVFQFQGECPQEGSEPPDYADWIPVFFDFRTKWIGTAGGGHAHPGKGSRWYQCVFPYDSTYDADQDLPCTDGFPWRREQVYVGGDPNAPQNFEALVVHEVGHAIGGLLDSPDRPDWPAITDPFTVDAWNCAHAGPVVDQCAPVEPNPNPRGEGYTAAVPHQYVDEYGVNRTCWTPERRTRGTHYPTPVDFFSIMWLWHCEPDRRDADGDSGNPPPNYYWLSALDDVAINVLYPKSATRGLRADYGFSTAGGLVARTNSQVMTDWDSAGAWTGANGVYASTPYVDVGIDAAYSGNRLPATSLGTGTRSVSVSFTDLLTRTQTGTQTVIVNNARHTAIVMTARLL